MASMKDEEAWRTGNGRLRGDGDRAMAQQRSTIPTSRVLTKDRRRRTRND